MLSNQVQELETENKRLREVIQRFNESLPKPKDCENCKHYKQHYGKDAHGNFHIIYMGHCTCGVPAGRRKGKKNPTPEDTCLCFEKKTWKWRR